MDGERELVVVAVGVVLGCGAGPLSAGSEVTSSEGSSSSSTSESTTAADETETETGEPECEAAWVDEAIAGFGARAPVVADIDGDGHLDAFGLRPHTLEIELLWGDGEGGFTHEVAPAVELAPPGGVRVLVGDVDGDGASDLAFYHMGILDDPDAVAILQQLQPRVFGPPVVTVFPGDWSHWEDLPMVFSDVNGDAREDLVLGNSRQSTPLNLSTALADGQGGFAQPILSSLLVWCFTQEIASADFDGDLDDEFVVTGPWTCNGSHDPTPMVVVDIDAGGEVTILGEFDVGEQHTDLGNEPPVADFDGDGWLDFAVVNRYDVSLFRGLGDGSFEPRPRVAVFDTDSPALSSSQSMRHVTAGDFNGDGAQELFVVVHDYAGDGPDPAFLVEAPLGPASVTSLGSFARAWYMFAGDFDEDGCDDLLYYRLPETPEDEHAWHLRRCAGLCD